MKAKSHEVRIRVRFDAEVTASQARFAVWNNLQGYELFGDGKPSKLGLSPEWGQEPYGRAVVRVPKR